MIPILYENTETSFTSNGLGRLVDCTRCLVTEERNGVYEVEFDIPISSPMYPEVNEGRIIAVTHDDGGDIQPFDIYHRTAPLNGIVTFYAHHISYRQNGIVVKPFTASGVANAITGLKTNSVGTNSFTYITDKTTAGDYTVSEPQSLKALLGGTENSLLDVFGGGEYEFDVFDVHLWARRGTDTDVQIRYGKNLSDISHDIDYIDAYNGIVPYWYGDDGNGSTVLVTLSEWAIYSSGAPYDGRNTVYPMNLTDKFEAMPTENELRTMATSIMSTSEAYLAKENITVSFVQMWQTEEYKSIAPLQSVKLCDTVSVYYEELGVDITSKVIKVVYNTLLDRYDEVELGQALETYAAIISSATESQMAQLENGLVIVQNAAAQALSDAAAADRAAQAAVADAGDALIAAGNAVTAAGNAMTAAGNAATAAQKAQASADSAYTQASTANAYANSALDQLNIVQDVVGVLDLLSTNATYQLTADTEIQPGKWYFTRSGTSPDYVYTVVNTPDVDDIGTYYEMVSIDSAVQNYVTSKLTVTSQGLWIQEPTMQTRILLSATDGVVLYGPNGTVIGKYGSTAQIGDAAGFHIEMDGTELGFYQATRKVAYISNNQLYITQSVVLQQMDLGIMVADGGLGQWSWKVHANGDNPPRNNLNLKWVG